MVDGSVTCWGTDSYGQLGTIAQLSSSVPMQVYGMTGLTPATTAISVSVSMAAWHSCAVMADGKVKCWGLNNWGQLGNDSTDLSKIPVPVTGITGADAASTAISVSAGQYHTCAVMADGSATCWGANASGQLGNNLNTGSSVPVPVSGITGADEASTAVSISAGGNHSCALMRDGKVLCWGSNNLGQLGDDSTTDRAAPVQVYGITGLTAESIAVGVTTGFTHSCALMENGTVACWGNNQQGQLGNGNNSDRSVPVPVSVITGLTSALTAVSVSSGIYHSCALMQNGTAECWGYNWDGELGNNSTTDSSVPVQVSDSAINGLTTATTAVSVSAGGNHSCALMTDGTAACWGHNTYGELGDNSTENSLVPVPVSDITGADSTFGHTLTPSLTHLSRPVQLLVTGRAADSIAISWGVPTDNGGKHIDSYRVSYRPEGSLARATYAIVPYSQLHLRVRGLSAGVTYRFRVRAHNVNGFGDRSRFVSETVPVRAAAPIVVKGVWDHRVITLTWRAVQAPAHSPISAFIMSCRHDKDTRLRTTVNPSVLTASMKVPTARPYSCRVAAITDAGRGASSVRLQVPA